MKIYNLQEIQDIPIEEMYSKIINGNCIELLRILPLNSIDLIVTSPPYDDLRDYEKKVIWNFEIFKPIAKELYNVMKLGGVIVWVVGDKTKNGNKSLTSFKQALYFQEIGFKVYDVIIYEKTGSGPPHPNRYSNIFEYMFIISKGKPKTINILNDKPNKWAGVETFSEVTRRESDGTLTKKGKKTVAEFGVRTNIWKYVNGKGFSTKDKDAYKHPAIFPEKLAKDHILSWSNEGDVILDIFGGSGTTVKQAQLLNRRWIYVDKVEKYCEITLERMKACIPYKYQTIIYETYNIKEFNDKLPTFKKDINESGHLFVITNNIYENNIIKESFFDFIESAIEKGFQYINTIIFPVENNSRNLKQNIKYLLWFVNDMNSMYFDKDTIREKHIWKDVEWGKRKKNYNEKGKDPSNIWIPTLDDGKGKITEHIILSREELLNRCIISTSQKNEYIRIYSNKKIDKNKLIQERNIQLIINDPTLSRKDSDTDGSTHVSLPIISSTDCDNTDGDGYDANASENHISSRTDCNVEDESLNLIDQDGDGPFDCDDDGCSGYQVCSEEEPSSQPSEEVSTESSNENSEYIDNDGDELTENDGDCDDTNPEIFPGSVDYIGDNIDQSCDGMDGTDGDGIDTDQDGFASISSSRTDCDNNNPEIFPDADDLWYNGVDADCAGNSDFDQDGDVFDSKPYGNGTDCNDQDPAIAAYAPEIWYDGIDQNCDGDGFTTYNGHYNYIKPLSPSDVDKYVLSICNGECGADVYFSSSESMKEIKDQEIGLMVTSPPYWNLKDYFKEGQIGQESYKEYINRLNKVWSETFRVLKDNGSMWININTITRKKKPILIPNDIIKECKKIGFKLKEIIIWHKSSGIPTHKNNLVDKHEYFLWFIKSDNYHFNIDKVSEINYYQNAHLNNGLIWNINRKAGSVGKNFVHPAIFPTTLIDMVIKLTSKKHDTVLDPFLGSGTSMISSLSNNRNFVGYEFNGDFLDLIKFQVSEHKIDEKDIKYNINENRKKEASKIFRKDL